MADHERSSTRSTHLGQSRNLERSGKSTHFPSKKWFCSFFLHSIFFIFFPWSIYAYATHMYAPFFQKLLRNSLIFYPPLRTSLYVLSYRQKTVFSIVTNLRTTALIVTTRTIILLGHFIPPERNVHRNRDTHNWIGDDTVSTITLVIIAQRSVKSMTNLPGQTKKSPSIQ